jgi:hypothetical protein
MDASKHELATNGPRTRPGCANDRGRIMKPMSERQTNYAALIYTAFIVLASAVVLYLMGRTLICTCGYVKFWEADAFGSGNSQHLTDWYTFSHIIHGFLFYALLWWLFGSRWSFEMRLAAATLLEAGWEILENSPLIIDRYRDSTIATGYYGDSVINSVFDILAMMLGFWLAARLPIWLTIALALIMEVAVAAIIRDNLTLNVLMLLWPIEAVKNWQAGA